MVDGVTVKAGTPLFFGPPDRGWLTAYAGPRSGRAGRQLRLAAGVGVHRPVGPPDFQAGSATTASSSGATRDAAAGAGPAGGGSVGVFHFYHVDVGGGRPQVTLQMRLNIERAGDLDAEKEGVSQARIQVRDEGTGELSPPIDYLPETGVRLAAGRRPVLPGRRLRRHRPRADAGPVARTPRGRPRPPRPSASSRHRAARWSTSRSTCSRACSSCGCCRSWSWSSPYSVARSCRGRSPSC